MVESTLLVTTETLEDGISALREDAERYRWLRQQQAANCWPQVVDGLHQLAGDKLDAAIDDAMRGEYSSPICLRLN